MLRENSAKTGRSGVNILKLSEVIRDMIFFMPSCGITHNVDITTSAKYPRMLKMYVKPEEKKSFISAIDLIEQS